MSETQTIQNSAENVSGASILLDQVTKQYPGQTKPAVGGLTMEIPAGSIVMFVGPSGCGKTTTLKMINRLIEPTDGSIVINGDNVTDMNGDKLRRQIGYVIQAGGLFPHMSVAANIGLVPKMLGWDKDRIAARVDELLELVSLDPRSIGIGTPRNFRVVSSSASAWPVRSPRTRPSCSWMNRSARLTPSPANACRTSCSISRPSCRKRSSASPTTSTRP